MVALWSLIKANKLIFSLIAVGTLGVTAVGVGCGVYFGKFYNTTTTTSVSMTTTTTPSCPFTDFWNGTSCTPRKTYNESCTASYQCTFNVSLACDSTSNRCLCSSSSTYWDTVSLSCSKINKCIIKENLVYQFLYFVKELVEI